MKETNKNGESGPMKTYSLEEVIDMHIGKRGTPKREEFEFELQLHLLGDMIKKTRKEQNLTQEQLGKLLGVQKAQISKIENNVKDVRISTIMRVFKALKAKVTMRVEFDKENVMEIG
mgnify:CR=1 FL=1